MSCSVLVAGFDKCAETSPTDVNPSSTITVVNVRLYG